MSKNIAAHQKKVEHAVQKILKAPGLSIPDAIVLDNFSKKDVANETLRRAVHRAVKRRRDQALLGLCAPPPTAGIIIFEDPSPSLSDLSSLTGESSAPPAPQFPKPKRRQPTASAVQQRCVNDLKAKRHKSNEHKAAVRLYDIEKQKPNGMSVRKVPSVSRTRWPFSRQQVILLSWHQHPKVAGMKKEEKLSAWVAIVNRGKAPPSFEKWTNADDLKLMEAQSDVVEIEMAHTALCHRP
jgi:hypothetical protein